MAVQKRLIDDAGEKIEGARKDWKSFSMTADDLASMTDEEIVLTVKKDHVWPKPDYEAMVAEGMSVEAAAHVKVIRDRMAQEPRAYRGIDPIMLRREFVSMTGLVRDKLLSCVTVEDVKGVYRAVQQAVGGDFRSTEALRVGYMSVFKGNTCPFAVDYKDPSKVRKMLHEGFPGKQLEWKKGVAVRARTDGTFWVVKDGRILREGLASEQQAWDWAKDNYVKPEPKAKAGDGKIEPKRPHLDMVQRSGLVFSLEGRNVSPEDFIEEFGFRGVQFGLWLPDDERQRVLNMGYEALIDLADTLGWEPEMLSLGGTLALAFGARGKGGKAAAHYEAGQRVVNMTRMSGAGTLAHEYGHALDHWSGTGTAARIGGVPSGSGWYEQVGDRKQILAHRGQTVAQAWDDVMNEIARTPLDKAGKISQLTIRKAKIEENLAINRANIDKVMALEPARRNRNWLKGAIKWEMEKKALVSMLEDELEKLPTAPDGNFGYTTSEYSRQAAALCRSSDYWKRPTELFARAFEAWVHDAITEREGVSQYLVNGAAEQTFAGEEFRGNPYPTGNERKRINAAMQALSKALAPEAEMACRASKAPSP